MQGLLSSGSKKAEGTLFTTAPSAQTLKLDSMARAQQRLPITFAKPILLTLTYMNHFYSRTCDVKPCPEKDKQ